MDIFYLSTFAGIFAVVRTKNCFSLCHYWVEAGCTVLRINQEMLDTDGAALLTGGFGEPSKEVRFRGPSGPACECREPRARARRAGEHLDMQARGALRAAQVMGLSRRGTSGDRARKSPYTGNPCRTHCQQDTDGHLGSERPKHPQGLQTHR